jgi:hypothetical protein
MSLDTFIRIVQLLCPNHVLVLRCQARSRARARASSMQKVTLSISCRWSQLKPNRTLRSSHPLSFRAQSHLFTSINQESPAAQVIKMVNSKVIDFKLYRYAPSLGAAVVFIIRFGICASFHAWKLFQKRIFYFIPVLMGVLCKHGLELLPSLEADNH